MLLIHRWTSVRVEYGLKPSYDVDCYCCVFGLFFFYYLLSVHLRPLKRLADAKPDFPRPFFFFFFFVVVLRKFKTEIFAKFASKISKQLLALHYNMAVKSCPLAGKNIVMVTLAQTFLFRFWFESNTSLKARKYPQTPGVFLHDRWFLSEYHLQKSIQCREKRRRKIS